MQKIAVQCLTDADLVDAQADLAQVLSASVAAGAAVSFVLPFESRDAFAFFAKRVFPAVERGDCHLFAAWQNGRVVGTVQLWTNMPPNQPHRAEVAKLLVHPNARRQGVGRHLMSNLEATAYALGKTLITLDTRTGSGAKKLYSSLGYIEAGDVPNFALNPDREGFHSTTYMYKLL